jgi:hypothetical protein
MTPRERAHLMRLSAWTGLALGFFLGAALQLVGGAGRAGLDDQGVTSVRKRASPALPAGISLGSRNGRPVRLPSGEPGADLDVMPFALRISVITFGSIMCQNT